MCSSDLAKQTRHGADGPIVDRSQEMLNKVWPIVMHGDAAFAGQGIWAETLNLADLKGYTVGGTVHIVVNNLIGFTTPPVQEHSSRFASDIAKRQSVPVFHVNAEGRPPFLPLARAAAAFAVLVTEPPLRPNSAIQSWRGNSAIQRLVPNT